MCRGSGHVDFQGFVADEFVIGVQCRHKHRTVVRPQRVQCIAPGECASGKPLFDRPSGHNALSAKPLAVVGASMGHYGGVWAHDEARKSFGIAGVTKLAAQAG
jgi:hypothetical protein